MIASRSLKVASSKAGPANVEYVQLVIFENASRPSIIGSKQAPYMTGLARVWANMTESFAITHPSEPNYLALFSGSTQGVAGDPCPITLRVPNIASELSSAGISFTGLAESMPSDGYQGCEAMPSNLRSKFLYMRKHVPWVNFTNVPSKDNKAYHAPMVEPPSRFVWITPNMCNDMHDCSISVGDKWASDNLPKLIAWDRLHHGVLILTFDENDGSPGNQIATILAGCVNPGSYAQKINHYSVLRTIEDVFGIGHLGASAFAQPIKGVLK